MIKIPLGEVGEDGDEGNRALHVLSQSSRYVREAQPLPLLV